MRLILLFIMAVCTWALFVFHRSVLIPPAGVSSREVPVSFSQWFKKSEHGLNHVFLTGSAYERGYAFGKLTQPLILREEAELYKIFNHLIPNRYLQLIFSLAAGQYFMNIDELIEPRELEEMYGISQFAGHDMDFLIDPFTKQLALHGLHEVGQMMVDSGLAMGCTLFRLPTKSGFLIGRNFDFEAGRVFDEEKILKWNFPEDGNAYVSVTWAGMLGVVTGVNSKGLWISLNAAGTDDWRRIGVPTTLVALRVLEKAEDLDDAIQIIQSTPTFISEIFVVADQKTGRGVRIEKSPARFAMIPLEDRDVVANHFNAEVFASDDTNESRKKNQTSSSREERGRELIAKAAKFSKPEDMAVMLRDKKALGDQDLPLGNRAAIDSGIATHAAIFDSAEDTLYVSSGPALAGEFIGYKIQESFQKKRPILARKIGADKVLNISQWEALNSDFSLFRQMDKDLTEGHCPDFEKRETEVSVLGKAHHEYWRMQGDYFNRCLKNEAKAQEAWQLAMDLHPPYSTEREALRLRLEVK